MLTLLHNLYLRINFKHLYFDYQIASNEKISIKEARRDNGVQGAKACSAHYLKISQHKVLARLACWTYKKSNLHYTCLIPFRVSPNERYSWLQLCARAHTSMLQRWRVVGNVMRDLIGSGFELHTSRTRGRRLTPCAIMLVNFWENQTQETVGILISTYVAKYLFRLLVTLLNY